MSYITQSIIATAQLIWIPFRLAFVSSTNTCRIFNLFTMFPALQCSYSFVYAAECWYRSISFDSSSVSFSSRKMLNWLIRNRTHANLKTVHKYNTQQLEIWSAIISCVFTWWIMWNKFQRLTTDFCMHSMKNKLKWIKLTK